MERAVHSRPARNDAAKIRRVSIYKSQAEDTGRTHTQSQYNVKCRGARNAPDGSTPN